MSQERILVFGMELSNKKWRLCFSEGSVFRQVSIVARDQAALVREVQKARKKFHLGEDCRVVSGYEAGRDGFWIHRFLHGQGIDNRVLDPASIEVNRRHRRQKTDPLDAEKLTRLLLRAVLFGEKGAFRQVHVPSPQAESAMRVYREREKLKKEFKSHLCRMQALLVLYGLNGRGIRFERCCFEDLRDWQGQALPADLIRELNREQQRLVLVRQQLKEVEQTQKERLKHPRSRAEKQGQQLTVLLGVGLQSAWALGHEFFGWRRFRNRRQVGACAGLVSTPYASGDLNHEQGISKSGNRRIRHVMVELAWIWLRYQGGSDLSRWFEERFGQGTKRLRRIGIVALARKLLVALWKFVETGEVPHGAVLGGAIR